MDNSKITSNILYNDKTIVYALMAILITINVKMQWAHMATLFVMNLFWQDIADH